MTSTIVIANNGPNPAADTTLVDTFFGGNLDQVSATTPGAGNCSYRTDGIDCTLGTLAPGATVTVTVTGRIPPGSTTTQVGNTSSVSSPTPDPT